MIYTMQRWPDVLSKVIYAYVTSSIVVLKAKDNNLVICLPSGEVELPFQESVALFLSQPYARRDFSKQVIDDYDHFIVDMKKGLVCIETAKQAKHYIDATIEKEVHEDAMLNHFEQGIKRFMRNWINAQMEYLPLDDDEEVQIYSLHKKVS